MTKPIAVRINESLNVSGTFDNCFFHTYAIHLLANELPLPNDLFSFKSILGEQSAASELQKRLPNLASLELFAEYTKSRNPDEVVPSTRFIVEKVLVLGILMREWFATQLSEKFEITDEYEKAVILQFRNYKEFRAYMDINDLRTGNEAVLYKANEAFLEYFTARPESGGSHPDYEKYFTDSAGDTDKAIRAYLQAKGYQKYYQLIATFHEKLAYTQVVPTLRMQNQAFTMYNYHHQTMIHSHEGDPTLPRLEIALDVGAGHYHLLKTDKTSHLCAEYERGLTQYLADRTLVLSNRNPIAAANTCPSLLVGAICPAEHIQEAPFTLLFDKVDILKNHKYEMEFNKAIQLLANKKAKFKDHPKSKDIHDTIETLCDELEVNGRRYFRNKPTPESYQQFKKQCEAAIKIARPQIDKHRGLTKIVINILAVIATLGIGYAIAAGINMNRNKGKFTFFSTDSALKVNDIQDSVNKAACGAKPLYLR